MPLPVPNLDDRRFQDILDEARRKIPLYCPEWTDHNLSDPGITLLELFAWMTDLLLYRLNRVPDKNYVKFLELMGVRLLPAVPAKADLTFRLTAPAVEGRLIPRGTEVGTVRTETQESITFATERDLLIRVPELIHVLACRQGTRFLDYRPAIEARGQGFGVFSDVPQEDDGLYLGFANDLSAHTLAITLNCRIEGIGVDPTDPPLAWETWDGLEERWVRLAHLQDTTGGLNRNGVVIGDTPYGAAPTVIDGKAAFWVRCRVLRPRPGQGGYSDSPRLTAMPVVQSLGGMVPASHATRITGELLGISDGTPGQRFQLHALPVLPRREGETLEVEIEHEDGTFSYEPWVEVAGFGASGENDPHFVLDDATGTIELGPRIRTPRGEERQFGRVPPAGRKLRFSAYRTGGGVVGNVGAGTLSVLKSSIPYVEWVTNYAPATGGLDTETLEHAKLRGPEVLRARHRAVTAEDFEVLALEASAGVERARCLMPGVSEPAPAPGSVPGMAGARAIQLLLVPAVHTVDRPVSAMELQIPARVRQEVQAYLDERRLLGCELMLESPVYTWVSVTARLRARPEADPLRVAGDAERALYRYLHPTVGGADGGGWPFGEPLYVADLFALLQHLLDVEAVEEVVMRQVDPTSGAAGDPVTTLPLPEHGLLCSAEHHVTVEASRHVRLLGTRNGRRR